MIICVNVNTTELSQANQKGKLGQDGYYKPVNSKKLTTDKDIFLKMITTILCTHHHKH